MRPKTVIKDNRGNTLGPGAYNPLDRVAKLSVPNCKFGTSTRENLINSSANPGPGSYYSEKGRENDGQPKFSFGSSTRGNGFGDSKNAPGPGACKIWIRVEKQLMRGTDGIRSNFDTNLEKLVGKTLLPRRPNVFEKVNGNPGPGSCKKMTFWLIHFGEKLIDSKE